MGKPLYAFLRTPTYIFDPNKVLVGKKGNDYAHLPEGIIESTFSPPPSFFHLNKRSIISEGTVIPKGIGMRK